MCANVDQSMVWLAGFWQKKKKKGSAKHFSQGLEAGYFKAVCTVIQNLISFPKQFGRISKNHLNVWIVI